MSEADGNKPSDEGFFAKFLSEMPLINVIPAFNPKKRAEARKRYIAEYKRKDPSEIILEQDYFKGRSEVDLVPEAEFHLRDRVEEYEKRAESFLTLLTSGGLIFIATIFQGYNKKMGYDLIFGSAMLILSFAIVSFLKIHQTNTAYFRLGEWQKNRLNYMRGEIDLAEFHWRIGRSHKMSSGFALLAISSLCITVLGIYLIFHYFMTDSFQQGGPAAVLPGEWV